MKKDEVCQKIVADQAGHLLPQIIVASHKNICNLNGIQGFILFNDLLDNTFPHSHFYEGEGHDRHVIVTYVNLR